MLELDALRRVFGDVVALDGLSFAVRRGELCGFLGPNGSGKTTAMRAVLGVTRLDGGEVRWQGAPITAQMRAATGYLPEERGLYAKMPIGEQLVYFARLHGSSTADATVRVAGLLDKLGLGDRMGDPTEKLSLGNQQRVQFAAALVHEPDLLVLDEPFSGLDPIAVDTMSLLLREQAERGAAVVFSSHQLDLVEDLCTTVAIVNRGRTVLHGPVRELKRRGPTRLRVRVDGDDGWLASIPAGAEVVGRIDGEVTLVLGDDVDAVGVLQHARASGAVTSMSLEQPRLSELFRDAMEEGA
ncbi:MAG TPA: ATP-binding cassette domain-containing protein [Egicoccus sp.]|nr:ATP-binding cassette domain-containing protein [Egicoccus sp.]HSK22312.1 ATP-binding cassette domain-containing protein [Egicoccus sp.]